MRIQPVIAKDLTANGICDSFLIAVGNVINVETGDWTGKMSGLGAGLDSFYEYLLKVRIKILNTLCTVVNRISIII